jgi:hypothetical protein
LPASSSFQRNATKEPVMSRLSIAAAVITVLLLAAATIAAADALPPDHPVEVRDAEVEVAPGAGCTNTSGGVRGAWLHHGLDLLRVEIGVDYRFDKHYTLSPFLGVAATRYLAERSERTMGFDWIDDPKTTWTFSAGLLARFGALGAE